MLRQKKIIWCCDFHSKHYRKIYDDLAINQSTINWLTSRHTSKMRNKIIEQKQSVMIIDGLWTVLSIFLIVLGNCLSANAKHSLEFLSPRCRDRQCVSIEPPRNDARSGVTKVVVKRTNRSWPKCAAPLVITASKRVKIKSPQLIVSRSNEKDNVAIHSIESHVG